jgi:hypothetical protein
MADQPAIIDPIRPSTRRDICYAMNSHTCDIKNYRGEIALSKARRRDAEKILADEKAVIRTMSENIMKSNIARDALLRDNVDSALYFVLDDMYCAIPEATAADRAWCEKNPDVRVIDYASITLLDQTRILWVIPMDDTPQ